MIACERIVGFLKKFERWIITSLILMMVLVVFVTTIELGWIIIKHLKAPPVFFLAISELLDIFGFFLLVLIGIELLETIKAYLVENVIHVEVVLEVAVIAIARKVIILDLEKYDGLTLIGTAALIAAVAAALFSLKRRTGHFRKSAD